MMWKGGCAAVGHSQLGPNRIEQTNEEELGTESYWSVAVQGVRVVHVYMCEACGRWFSLMGAVWDAGGGKRKGAAFTDTSGRSEAKRSEAKRKARLSSVSFHFVSLASWPVQEWRKSC